MIIRILGTGAASGWPGIFCGCSSCTRSRQTGGRSIRTRSSIMIDDIFKIDFPPDSYCHAIRYGLDLSRLKCLFFTHSHPDHFAPDELEYLRAPFAADLHNAPVTIYGNSQVISAVNARCERHDLPVELHEVQPYIPILAGNLTFTPVIAKHSATELCLNYIVQSNTATILYACDTGLYNCDTMQRLCEHRFDAIIVECTRGMSEEPSETHMSMGDIVKLRSALAQCGAVGQQTRIILTHLAHTIGLMHDELTRIAGESGLEVGYDGMIVEV